METVHIHYIIIIINTNPCLIGAIVLGYLFCYLNYRWPFFQMISSLVFNCT
jgi:hypothetical protein